ncbi:hypothetical protein CUMW_191480 [Citrus unshiu]|uniref:Uncharacterized protein n=1 Tax=Citrus unshiu TaxID=55188 RepID=A0A2H5Q3B6_CITUN|nr:hypothetical protein CUMW_191480 [Citrus unshiu]
MLNETKMKKKKKMQAYFSKGELMVLIPYAIAFYVFIIRRSLQISHDHFSKLYGLRPGWLFSPQSLNDVSDAQWRNFRSNLPILTVVFTLFAVLANTVLHEETAFRFYFGSSTYSSLFLIVFTKDIRSRYLVILRMISFGYDYHWAQQGSHFDHEKHVQRCHVCKSGKLCYQIQQVGSHLSTRLCTSLVTVILLLPSSILISLGDQKSTFIAQERNISENYTFAMYLCYLVYAPLYISGPIISFNAFASQLEVPQNNYLRRDVLWYGLRWIFSLLLMELMTHIFYYNAFAVSGMWKLLSPLDVFIVGYGVLNFMWLKFFLIWRYFRLWSLICGIEAPENMPRKLLSWAWLTCLFFIPEMVVKSAADSFQAESAFGRFLVRELRAFAGSITITCLMIANLVGYVIGPSGVNWLMSQFLTREGLPVLGGMFLTFYVGTKLMFQISDAKQRKQ